MAENMTIFPTGLTYSRNTKAPLMDMQVFETLALAQAYVDNKDQTAYVGLTVSVTKDGSNNGLYYVERIADADNATGLLVKVGSDAAASFAGQTVNGAETEVTYTSSNVSVATVNSETEYKSNASDRLCIRNFI